MTNRMIDADVFLDWITKMHSTGLCVDLIHVNTLTKKINELATPVEPQENCKSNLTKFTMQLFETIGQNVEAGKIDINDDSFDKMETIAFRLIDAIKIQAPTPEPQEIIFDAEGWSSDFTNVPDEYLAHNGCRLAWVDGDTITPLGDIFAFDEDYFRKSVKQWRPMPTLPKEA